MTGIAVSSHAAETELLVAHYTIVNGTDPEYAQGAIEKCDLRHAPIARLVWIIEVDAPADPAAWQRRLNEAVDPKHGAFRVRISTPEERERVRSGEIKLQR